jgi:hypothetical protein
MFMQLLIAVLVATPLSLKHHRALATVSHFQLFITQLAHD